ncbi:MAG: DMT family transporter [Streptosporangiaceae bacterium]
MTGTSLQPLAIGLAITAAATFAVANVVQQRVAARLRTDPAFDSAVLLRLLRQPLWLAGLGLVILSLSLQATALGLGRLVVIEPVLASSLLFALALSARVDRRRMRPVEWLAALATFAGLVVFLSVARPSGGTSTAPPLQLGLAAAAAVVIAIAAVAVSARRSPLRRALTLGIGGGIAAGVTDALTKTVAVLVGGRQFGAFADPRLYLLVVIGLMTYTLQQNGYRAASLAVFLPVFSVLDPAVGSILGLFLYHEHLGDSPVQIAAEAAAVLAATWGIARLATSTAQAETVEPVAITVPEPAGLPLAPAPLGAPPLAAAPPVTGLREEPPA